MSLTLLYLFVTLSTFFLRKLFSNKEFYFVKSVQNNNCKAMFKILIGTDISLTFCQGVHLFPDTLKNVSRTTCQPKAKKILLKATVSSETNAMKITK